MTVWETVLFTIFNNFSIVFGSFANLLVIISFIVFSSIREGTSLFLISLSVADFLVCTVYQPLLVYCFNHPDQNKFYVLTQSFLGYCLFTASLNGLLTVTFDRFVAIYFPYKYVVWITERNTALLIKLSWVVSLVTGTFTTTSSTGARIIAHVYTTVIIVAVPILYCIIFNEARKQARRLNERSTAGTRALPRGHPRLIYKATTGVGVVLVTTLLCWLPVILFPAFTAGQEADGTISKAMLWCFTAACANSCINPFIYCYKFHSFRINIRKLLHRILQNINRRDTRKVYPSHDPSGLETFPRTAWTVDNAPPAETG